MSQQMASHQQDAQSHHHKRIALTFDPGQTIDTQERDWKRAIKL